MPIRLIADSERFSLVVGDSVLYYRRMPSHVQKSIEARHTSRGQIVDQRAVVEEVLQYCLIDWDNVLDAEGQRVPFKRELIQYLGESAKADLVAALYAASPLELSAPSLSGI